MNRREFVIRSSAALATVAGAPWLSDRHTTAAEAPPRRKIPFGFSLYGMRSLPVPQALQTCGEIGYDCVELACMQDWPCDPEKMAPADRATVRKTLGDTNLQLACLMENLHAVVGADQHRSNLDRLKSACELGHALSPDNPPPVETILGGKPAQWDEIKGEMVKRLRDWAGEQAKTVIAVKPHVGGALHTPEGAQWLVDKIGSPWIRLVYDFSHFRLRDFSLADSLKLLIGASVFVHIKDTRGTVGKFEFLLPGEGDIDYVAYFKLLDEARYHGTVVVEVSGQIHGKPGYDPIAAAKSSYEKIAPTMVKAGVRMERSAGSR
jgi:sugar phosphate isomerase/epimerase